MSNLLFSLSFPSQGGALSHRRSTKQTVLQTSSIFRMALIVKASDLSKRYLDILDDPEFWDLKIICSDGEIQANKTILSMKTWPPNSFSWSSSNTSPERLKQAFHGSRISWSERITPNCREISSVKRRRKASEKAKDIRASPTLTSTETFSKLALSVFCLRIQNNKER